MFENINDIPEAIAEFYEVITIPKQLFEDDGITSVLRDEKYLYQDENGNELIGSRAEPVIVNVDVVARMQMKERKSIEDVWRIAAKHRGNRDDLIRLFLVMVCRDAQWSFHDEYLEWYKRGLELKSVASQNTLETEELHQELLATHETKEPVKPQKLDIDKWFIDNARQLRLLGYAPAHEQAEMHFNDAVNGTTILVDHNLTVKSQYPKA